MLVRLIAVVLVTLLSALMTLIILLDGNISKKIKAGFLLLAFGMSGWQVFSVLSDLQTDNALILNRLVFVFPIIALMGLLFFAEGISKDKSRQHTIRDLVISVAALLTTLSPYVVTGVTPRTGSHGEFVGNNVVRGPLYPVFLLFVAGMGSTAIVRLAVYYKSASKEDRRKVKFILYGFLSSLVLGILTNIILPLVFGSSSFAALGALSGVVFIGSVALSVTRYQFLDIRPVIARAASYFLSVAFLITVYAAIAAVFVRNFVEQENDTSGMAITTFLLIAVTLLYQPLKVFFDRTTRHLFYRDAYDPQDFLDHLNQVLVSTIDLKALLHSSSEIIERNLKADFCAFAIHETSYQHKRIIGSAIRKLDQSQISEAIAAAPDSGSKVFVASSLQPQQHELKKVMQHHNIAVLVRLASASQPNVEGVGYIMLGSKKSGNLYSSQDIKILEIIANELVIAIQNALRFEEIQNFNIKLQEEIERQTHQLKRTNEKLRLLDETKDDFISMASHQLRTPLTSVKGYLSMVLEGDAGKVNSKQEKLLNQAFISSQRMVYLIADLLNVSRLRTGKFVIEATPTNLAEIIEGEVEQLVETAAARGLELTYKKPRSFPTLMLDETKIRQVIMNFIDNAIYYTPSGGHIEVALGETEQSITFNVTDDGIGVAKHEQPHLFTKFFRAGNARKARPDGTGLGLFMAKKVVIAQGGSILYKDHRQGSTFGFIFAKARLQVPDNLPAPAEKEEAEAAA